MSASDFDFSSLNGHASKVLLIEDRIKSSIDSQAAEGVEIGRMLLEAKAEIPRGKFTKWIAARFTGRHEIRKTQAKNYMAVATFVSKWSVTDHLGFTVLVELARKGVPEAAIAEVVALSEQGSVSVKDAKAIVKRHKPPAKKKEKIAPSAEQQIEKLLALLSVESRVALAKKLNSELKQDVPESLIEDDPADLKPPKKVDTPEVRKAWKTWCRYNEKRKAPIVMEQASLQLKSLGNCKPETAVARIEWSIANGESTIVLAKDIRKDFEAPTLEQAIGYGTVMKFNPEYVRDWFYYFAESGWKKYNSSELIEDWKNSLHRWVRKNAESDTPTKKYSLRDGFVPTPDPAMVGRSSGVKYGQAELATAASRA